MTVVQHRFEGLADTTALTTGNTGGPAGTAFSTVTGAITASTDFAAAGTRSMKCVTSASTTSTGRDTTALGTLTTVRGRMYVRLSASPAANLRLAMALNGTTMACGVGLSTTRNLRLNDSASTQMAVGSTPLPTGQWIRIEWEMVASATVGRASAWAWFTASSTGAPDVTIASGASFNTLAQFTSYDAGLSFSTSQTYTAYLDEIAWTDGALLGPYADPVTLDTGFESGTTGFDTATNVATSTSYGIVGTGARIDSRAGASFLRVGPTSTGPGRRWVTVRGMFRLPLGNLTENAALLRLRNTDPLASGGGGNGDVWVQASDGSVRGDLQPGDSFSTAAGLITTGIWHSLRVVCAFKDDGTSSMKVSLDGVEIGSITSTLNTVGQALQFVELGAGTAVDAVVDWDQLTVTVSDSTLGYLPQAIPIEPALETDTAQVLGKTKRLALPISAEVGTAQAVTATKRLALAAASEADAAQAVTGTKALALPAAIETSSAQTLGKAKQFALPIAGETDAGQPLTGAKRLALPAAAEVGTALVPAAAKALALPIALSLSSAETLGRRKSRALSNASEIDAAQHIDLSHTGAVAPGVLTGTITITGRATATISR